jgi:hypothetical protein
VSVLSALSSGRGVHRDCTTDWITAGRDLLGIEVVVPHDEKNCALHDMNDKEVLCVL